MDLADDKKDFLIFIAVNTPFQGAMGDDYLVH
jgi:hypothetical protein